MTDRLLTASVSDAKPLDLDEFIRWARDLPAEPIGEWMRSQDRAPEQWHVIFPMTMLECVHDAPLMPTYVSFSDMVDEPVFVPRNLWAWVP